MKKLLLVVATLALACQVNGAVVSTNVLALSKNLGFIVLSGRANVSSITLLSAYNCTVDLYDCNSSAAPYFGTNGVTASYVSRSGYATNMVGTYVGYNGYTNWYTNTGYFTYNVTNAAATNELKKLSSLAVAPNVAAVFPVDLLFTKGVSLTADTNVTVILNYNSGQ